MNLDEMRHKFQKFIRMDDLHGLVNAIKSGEIDIIELFDRFSSKYILYDVFMVGAVSIMSFLLGTKDDILIKFTRKTLYSPGILHEIIRYQGFTTYADVGGKRLQALKMLLPHIPTEQFTAITEYEEEWEDDDGELYSDSVDYSVSELLNAYAGEEVTTLINEEASRRGVKIS